MLQLPVIAKRFFAGPVARTLAAWLAWVDVPASLRSALLGAALLVACHELLARSAPLLWPSLVSKGRAISRRQSRVTDDGDAPKSGVMWVLVHRCVLSKRVGGRALAWLYNHACRSSWAVQATHCLNMGALGQCPMCTGQLYHLLSFLSL